MHCFENLTYKVRWCSFYILAVILCMNHIRIEIPQNQKWCQHIWKIIEDTLGGILVTQSESVF